MFYVYILQSKKDHKYYIGSTADLEARLSQHNGAAVQSTKNRIPLKLVYQEMFTTLAEARKREAQIKRYKDGNAFKKLLSN